jgi:hypothetical protein
MPGEEGVESVSSPLEAGRWKVCLASAGCVSTDVDALRGTRNSATVGCGSLPPGGRIYKDLDEGVGD